jgi:hypothetical protein
LTTRFSGDGRTGMKSRGRVAGVNDENIFDGLNDWLGDHKNGLYREILDLLIARHVFREVHGIVEANPEVRDTPSTFWSWMDALYPAWASMVIRRLSDDRRGSKSFLRFLRELQRRPELLGRERFVRHYRAAFAAEAESIGNREFDLYAGRGETHIPRSTVEADIERLRQITRAVLDVATTRIAHIDPTPSGSPTFGQLDECIDFFEKMLRKYVMLFRAIGGDILPSWGFDWMAIFRKPWLP